MEQIRVAIENTNFTSRRRTDELFSALNKYYKKDHLKAYLVASILLKMDLLVAEREEVELKICVSSYYAGLYTIGYDYAKSLLSSQPDSALYKYNINRFEEVLNLKYDYCLYIWEGGYNWFIDIVRALKWRLEQEGKSVIISDKFVPSMKTVVFGANRCIQSPGEVPLDAIIYNFEQLYDHSPWNSNAYTDLLRTREIWDYSSQNITWLNHNKLGKDIKHVKLNYAPTLKFRRDSFLNQQEDIDVLFIGWINERRQAILDEFKEREPELNVVFTPSSWGKDRDDLILRSKIVLNIHYYETGILEAPRISYMVANEKFVISESSNKNEENEWLGVVFVPHERIVEETLRYLEDNELRRALSKKAFEHFSTQEVEIL